MADTRRDSRKPSPVITEEKPFAEHVVNIDRVARVVRGGRRFRFRALVVVGDGKGQVGVGVSKGSDVQAAVSKASDAAKKDMVQIPMYKDTIPHDVTAKIGGAQIFLKPAAPGTGVIAGGVVRTVVEAAGVSNLLSKSLGSTNKVNAAYATVKALRQLKPASEWVIKGGASTKATREEKS